MAGFLVHRSPNNRNILPYVNPTIFVGCLFKNLSLVNKWRLILWLVVSVTLCYVDVWFWSSHDLGLTSRHRVQRESLKTVTKLDPELTGFCIRSESLIFLFFSPVGAGRSTLASTRNSCSEKFFVNISWQGSFWLKTFVSKQRNNRKERTQTKPGTRVARGKIKPGLNWRNKFNANSFTFK